MRLSTLESSFRKSSKMQSLMSHQALFKSNYNVFSNIVHFRHNSQKKSLSKWARSCDCILEDFLKELFMSGLVLMGVCMLHEIVKETQGFIHKVGHWLPGDTFKKVSHVPPDYMWCDDGYIWKNQHVSAGYFSGDKLFKKSQCICCDKCALSPSVCELLLQDPATSIGDNTTSRVSSFFLRHGLLSIASTKVTTWLHRLLLLRHLGRTGSKMDFRALDYLNSSLMDLSVTLDRGSTH